MFSLGAWKVASNDPPTNERLRKTFLSKNSVTSLSSDTVSKIYLWQCCCLRKQAKRSYSERTAGEHKTHELAEFKPQAWNVRSSCVLGDPVFRARNVLFQFSGFGRSQGGACILSANVFYDLAQPVKISIMSMCPWLWWGHFPLQHFLVRCSRNYGNSFALLWKHKRKCFKLQGNLLKSIVNSQVLHCEFWLWKTFEKQSIHVAFRGPASRH